MFSRSFEWRKDEEFGEYGWILAGFLNFNVSNGLGVAHDTLEHFIAGDDGSLTAELRAFGAMVYGRGLGGYFLRNAYKTTEENLGYDFCNFLQELHWGKHSEFGCFLTPPKTRKLADEWAEQIIDGSLREGLKMFIAEGEYNKEEISPDDLAQSKEWIEKMRGWMRIGFRKAQKRFHNNDPHQIAMLFDRIVERIDKHHKYGDFGEILTVTVDPKRLKFKTSQEYRMDDY